MTFSEKVQWRCRHPDPKVDYASWVDKYRAKALVAGLIPVPHTYAIVRDPAEIATLALPDTFVMKATHGVGMTLLVENETVRGGNKWRETRGVRAIHLSSRRCYRLDELQAAGASKQGGAPLPACRLRGGVRGDVRPVDYEVQLFLFAGRFRLALVFFRPFVFKNDAHHIYDEDWTLREASAAPAPPCIEVPRPPASLFETLERLCRPIDHVRVDFMVSDGRYHFSEFTFTHNGKYGPGLIASFDAQLGGYWPR